MSKNLYAILGVANSATRDEIRVAYDASLHEAPLRAIGRSGRRAVAEPASPASRMPMAVGLALLGIAAAWWVLRPTRVPQVEVLQRAPAVAAAEPAAARPAVDAATEGDRMLLVGRWQCFGPLTGRGLDLMLDAQGNVSGTFDGKPVNGRYVLQGRQLMLLDGMLQVEEIDATRLVLNRGQGQRMVCNR